MFVYFLPLCDITDHFNVHSHVLLHLLFSNICSFTLYAGGDAKEQKGSSTARGKIGICKLKCQKMSKQHVFFLDDFPFIILVIYVHASKKN